MEYEDVARGLFPLADNRRLREVELTLATLFVFRGDPEITSAVNGLAEAVDNASDAAKAATEELEDIRHALKYLG